MKSIAIAFLLFTFSTGNSFAQPDIGVSARFTNLLDSSADTSRPFKELTQKRRDLQDEVNDFEDKISELEREQAILGPIEDINDRIEDYKREITDLNDRIEDLGSRRETLVKRKADLQDKLNRQGVSTDLAVDLADQIEQTDFLITDVDDDLVRFERRYLPEVQSQLRKHESQREKSIDNENTLDNNLDLLRKKEREIQKVDDDLAELLNRDNINNSFRLNISIAFTLLVAAVIIGFYVIAYRKEALALNIFSGEKGIQFITLFLIVISIILFGIMGTLESRELSALLGALSGYILGKTSSQSYQEERKPDPIGG